MTNPDNRSTEPLFEPLTRREREILALLAQGLSAPEIAEQLTVAISTVKYHIQHLYGKLGVHTKRKAVLRAASLSLLPLPEAGSPPGTLPGAIPFQVPRPAPGLPAARPSPKHNLPLPLTNFIGRAQQIADAKRLLRSNRLLTLTGAGGAGKTRLSLQIGMDILDDFAHGAWLVELAPIADPALVPEAVALALALHYDRGQSLKRALTENLRDKTLLLILDNCEHLVGACAQLAEQLLRAAPGLCILATSREALGIAGENAYPVPALSVPDPRLLPQLDTLAQSEAVRLFVERARAVRPDFALTAENAQAVAHICQRLDGIPLALELAAARVLSLNVDEIATHLAERDRFRLLTRGSRTAPPRQQTLRGAIDWSYDLLSDAERSLLRRLAVFAGGWTLEAAGQMAAGPWETLDLLTQLVGKSLVLCNQQPTQDPRFSMLEIVREYAREKLVEAGEMEFAHGRHLAYYLALAEEARLELRGSGQVKWLDRLDRENDNLRAALAWGVKSVQVESSVRLAGALTDFWSIRGYAAEGYRWMEAALQLQLTGGSLETGAWQARALLGAVALDMEQDLSTSQARLQTALAIYRELGDQVGMAHVLFYLARHCIAAQKDYTRAIAKYQEALDVWTAAKDGWGVGLCLHWMGHAIEELGDRAQAREFYQRSVELLREAGDLWQLVRPLGDLARQSWADGDGTRARAVLEETLAAFEALGSQSGVVDALSFLASISAAQGDYAQARKAAFLVQKTLGMDVNPTGVTRLGEADYLQGHLVEARILFEAGLEGWREENYLHSHAWPLARLGCVAYRLGDLDQAALLLNQSLTFLGPTGWWWNHALILLTQADVARVRGEPETAAELYASSLRLIIKAIARPDVPERLEGFAKLATLAQRPQRAARLFGAAEALRSQIGIPIPAVERTDYDTAVVNARARLDPAAFTAAWAEGQGLSWEQAAEYALEP